ncbi:MAG: 50S ribosomal protein L10 [Bdellovibrio sp. CG_4_9_14_3_um_filter_39_7]|nr:MAG: 50S ribosomal protein L10 [Bdellovibrio sp. CG_4_9_14_3_um_filter_39_7]
MLKRSEKEVIIADLKKDLDGAKAVFLTNLIGISSNDAVALRKEIRETNGKVVVTRNTLFQKAAVGTYAEKLLSTLKGPSALAFAFDDAAAIAKCLKKAGDTFELVQLKGGFLEGKELSMAEVKQVADLPSRDQMLGTLLATFNAPVSAFARVIEAIREKKEKGELAV